MKVWALFGDFVVIRTGGRHLQDRGGAGLGHPEPGQHRGDARYVREPRDCCVQCPRQSGAKGEGEYLTILHG